MDIYYLNENDDEFSSTIWMNVKLNCDEKIAQEDS